MSRSFIEQLKQGQFPSHMGHFLEVKELPDRKAQEQIEERCGQLSAQRMEELGEDKGFAAGFYLPTPNTIYLVWNNKTRSGVEDFAEAWEAQGLPSGIRTSWREYKHYRDQHGTRPAQRMRRQAFRIVKDWVIQKRFQLVDELYKAHGPVVGERIARERNLAPFKPDKLGFFGGKIYEWEKFLFGPAYPLEAFARESREEGGIHPLWSVLVETNAIDPTATYEQWFFWVLEAQFKLNTEGVKGETDPPVEVQIRQLNQRNFYWSHAKVLLRHLQWLVRVAGQEEYADSYDALQRNFGVSLRPQRVVVAPEKPIEVADDSWEAVMNSVTRPRQLQA